MATRACVLSTLAAVAFGAFAVSAAAQDENPTTPGAIPNPGSYQGSMQLQHQSDQQDQQFRQQQQSRQQQYQQPGYQPRYGAPSAPRAAAAPPPRRDANAFGKESAGDIAAERINARGDWVGAVRIWRPLAARGDVSAQYNMGVMYDMGHGVPVNHVQAAAYYRLAAQKGYAAAMLNLGSLIVEHARRPADLVPAYTWFAIAAARDPVARADAEHNIRLVSAAMTRVQIRQAELQARGWSPH